MREQAIWPSVAAAFVAFSTPLEGVEHAMYADIRGLVTTAIGCLADPIELALAMPWVRADGSPATRDEVAADWHAVKGRPELARLGARAAEPCTTVRLTDEGVARVVGQRLDATVAALARRFPELPEWPADAQLAVLSLAWACGAGFAYPKLEACLRRRDFAGAALECDIRGNPRRSAAQRQLLLEAHQVADEGGDPSVLRWPG